MGTVVMQRINPDEHADFQKYVDPIDLIKGWVQKEQHCLIEGFFKREQQKPPHRRAKSVMISCPCRKCNPGMLMVA